MKEFQRGINLKIACLFGADISEDKMAFRYGVEFLELTSAKAKARKKDDYLNLSVEIELDAFIDKDGKLEEASLGKRTIAVNGVKFNTPYQKNNGSGKTEFWSNWFPIPNFELRVFPEKVEPIDSAEIKKTVLNFGMDMEDLIKMGWVKALDGDHYLKFMKLNNGYYKRLGSKQAGGNYSVKVTFMEVNPRVLSTQKLREFFNENSESI